MGFIAKIIGIIALVLLSKEGQALAHNNGRVLLFLLIIDFFATLALKNDVKKHGMNHNTPVTKAWTIVGLTSEILLIILSAYCLFKI